VKLDHVAIWVVDIESMRTFYEKYFDARSNLKYVNERQRFSSYFLTFPEADVGDQSTAIESFPGRDIASRTQCREETRHALQYFNLADP